MTHLSTNKRMILIAAWILLLVFMPVLSVHASGADKDFVRVGLTTDFSKRDSITIKNTNLVMGYCTDDEFFDEASIRTDKGITFTPDTGTYKLYKKTFSTYSKAVSEAASISALNNVNAYACSAGKGHWLIYVASSGGFTSNYLIRVSTGKGSFLIDGLTAGSFPQFRDSEGGIIQLSNIYQYRGRVEVGRYAGSDKLTCVNVLNIEDYIKGVVTNEMLPNWPMEALKAQAVCARSYAITTGGFGSSGKLSKGYVLGDSALHQVYKGAGYETANGNKAVDETRGEVVTCNNKVIKAFYFSTSGGSTESAEDVWNKGLNYLQSVPDIYETEPERKPWSVTLTGTQIENKLKKNGKDIGTLIDVVVTARSKDGHIYSLTFKGTSGNAVLEKDKIRSVLGLYSNKFKVIPYGSNPDLVNIKGADKEVTADIADCYVINGNYQMKKADSLSQYQVMSDDNITGFAISAPSSKGMYIFTGSGYGHGIGLSQSGAKGMAKAGYSYRQIIEHYYTGCKVN